MNQIDFLNPRNFEGTVFKRMKNIDFGYFIYLVTKYKSLNMIHPNNPLFKYIHHFTPYIPKEKKENKNQELNNKEDNINLEPLDINSIKSKDDIIQFNMKIRDLQRFQRFEVNVINEEYKRKVLYIQKNIRCFLKRINIIRLIYSIMIRNCLIGLLKIQKFYKKFAFRRDFKINFFTNFILDYRKEKSNFLKKILYTYEIKLQIKNKIFINEILKQRNEKASLIQKYWFNKLFREKVLKVINYERDKYTLLFPYYAKKVQIKILIDRKLQLFKNYNFKICPIRKMFILHIKHSDLQSKKYYCQLFADNILFSDVRFPIFQWKDSKIYNIIDFYKKGVEIIEVSENSESEDEEKKEEKQEEKYVSVKLEKKGNFLKKEEIIEKIKNEILEEIKEEEDNEDKYDENEEDENIDDKINEKNKENKEKIGEKKELEEKINNNEEKKGNEEIKNKAEENKNNNLKNEESEDEEEEEKKIEDKKIEDKKIEEKKIEDKKEESEDEEEEESEEDKKVEEKKMEEKKEESEEEEEEDESEEEKKIEEKKEEEKKIEEKKIDEKKLEEKKNMNLKKEESEEEEEEEESEEEKTIEEKKIEEKKEEKKKEESEEEEEESEDES